MRAVIGVSRFANSFHPSMTFLGSGLRRKKAAAIGAYQYDLGNEAFIFVHIILARAVAYR
jgi:hypothetical protein